MNVVGVASGVEHDARSVRSPFLALLIFVLSFIGGLAWSVRETAFWPFFVVLGLTFVVYNYGDRLWSRKPGRDPGMAPNEGYDRALVVPVFDGSGDYLYTAVSGRFQKALGAAAGEDPIEKQIPQSDDAPVAGAPGQARAARAEATQDQSKFTLKTILSWFGVGSRATKYKPESD